VSVQSSASSEFCDVRCASASASVEFCVEFCVVLDGVGLFLFDFKIFPMPSMQIVVGVGDGVCDVCDDIVGDVAGDVAVDGALPAEKHWICSLGVYLCPH
jgi:hypothetical protein